MPNYPLAGLVRYAFGTSTTHQQKSPPLGHDEKSQEEQVVISQTELASLMERLASLQTKCEKNQDEIASLLRQGSEGMARQIMLIQDRNACKMYLSEYASQVSDYKKVAANLIGKSKSLSLFTSTIKSAILPRFEDALWVISSNQDYYRKQLGSIENVIADVKALGEKMAESIKLPASAHYHSYPNIRLGSKPTELDALEKHFEDARTQIRSYYLGASSAQAVNEAVDQVLKKWSECQLTALLSPEKAMSLSTSLKKAAGTFKQVEILSARIMPSELVGKFSELKGGALMAFQNFAQTIDPAMHQTTQEVGLVIAELAKALEAYQNYFKQQLDDKIENVINQYKSNPSWTYYNVNSQLSSGHFPTTNVFNQQASSLAQNLQKAIKEVEAKLDTFKEKWTLDADRSIEQLINEEKLVTDYIKRLEALSKEVDTTAHNTEEECGKLLAALGTGFDASLGKNAEHHYSSTSSWSDNDSDFEGSDRSEDGGGKPDGLLAYEASDMEHEEEVPYDKSADAIGTEDCVKAVGKDGIVPHEDHFSYSPPN